MGKKIIFGKVTSVEDFEGGCKCMYKRSHFFINDRDYMEDISYYQVSYLSFPLLYEEIKNIPFGEHFESSEEYNDLKLFCSKATLTNYYEHTSSFYFETCYSEWTCGFAEDREVVRLGELEDLKDKYVIFILN